MSKFEEKLDRMQDLMNYGILKESEENSYPADVDEKEYEKLNAMYGNLTYHHQKLEIPRMIETVDGPEPLNTNFFPAIVHTNGDSLEWLCYMGSGAEDYDGNIYELNNFTRLDELPENNRENDASYPEPGSDYDGVFLTVDKDGTETIWAERPDRTEKGQWDLTDPLFNDSFLVLPKGTITKLTGKKLTWKDKAFYYDGR